MTWPRAKSDLLIDPASLSPAPCDWLVRTFSDPARSSSEIRPYRWALVRDGLVGGPPPPHPPPLSSASSLPSVAST